MAFHRYHPVAMEAAIGGGGDLPVEVQWRRGHLAYMIPGRLTLKIQPEEDDWLAFWEMLDLLEAWDWQREYGEREKGGKWWEVDIRHNGRRLRALGGAETPDGFDAFTAALTRLMGGAVFEWAPPEAA